MKTGGREMRGNIHSTLKFFFSSFPSVSFPYLIHHSICWLYVNMYFLYFFKSIFCLTLQGWHTTSTNMDPNVSTVVVSPMTTIVSCTTPPRLLLTAQERKL